LGCLGLVQNAEIWREWNYKWRMFIRGGRKKKYYGNGDKERDQGGETFEMKSCNPIRMEK